MDASTQDYIYTHIERKTDRQTDIPTSTPPLGRVHPSLSNDSAYPPHTSFLVCIASMPGMSILEGYAVLSVRGYDR